MKVPVVDFASYDKSGTSAYDELCQAVDDALTNVGFMSVTNLGVDSKLLNTVFQRSLAFFKSPKDHKRRSAYVSASENFGYQGLQEENLDPGAPPDLKETFTMRDVLNKPPLDTRWPDDEFRQLMRSFYANCFDASFKLQRVFADALNLDTEFFAKSHSGENVTLRLLYYPCSGVDSVQTGQMGAGAHTDYGLLTLLFQDTVGGLQVQDMQSNWIDVEYIPNAIVINSGDLLERWTNGRYRSTLHRVKPKIGARERLSIAMFVDPDSATHVEVLDCCTSSDNPAKYPAVTAGEHLQQKIEASHKERFTR
ncbi:MAG: 2OG-Fe(II) oxygenase family protein [Pseudomonadota bacterium]